MPKIIIKSRILPKAQFGPPLPPTARNTGMGSPGMWNMQTNTSFPVVNQPTQLPTSSSANVNRSRNESPFILAPQFRTTTTPTTGGQPPIPYAGAATNPNLSSTNPFSSNFSARDWARDLYMKPAKIEQKEPKETWAQKTQNYLNRLQLAVDPIRAGLAELDAYKKYKRSDRFNREANLPDNLYAVGQQSAPDVMGEWHLNTGHLGKQGSYVENKGQAINPTGFLPERGFYNTNAKYGGEQGMKIRITRLPDEEQMAYGGQAKHSLDIRRDALATPNITYENPYEVNDTLQPVPRDEANLEAEKDETVFGDIDGDGGFEHFNVGGKRHTQGGTPLNLPEGTFIFSDTAKMRIKDEEVLSYFGLKPKKGGYTPAEIAKRYDINKYKAMLENPESDELSKNTAQQMVNNHNKKLAYLALIQESMKGFPNGIPEVSQKILGLEPPKEQMASSEDEEMAMQMGQESEMEQPSEEEMMQQSSMQQEQPNPEEEESAQYYSYGGESELMKFQTQGQVPPGIDFSKARIEKKEKIPEYERKGYEKVADRYWYLKPTAERKGRWQPDTPPTRGKQKKGSGFATPEQARDWEKAIIKMLQSGMTPEQLVESGDIHAGAKERFRKWYIPKTTGMCLDENGKPDPTLEKDENGNCVKKGTPEDLITIEEEQVVTSTTTLPPGKPAPFAPTWPDVRNLARAGMFPPRNYSAGIKTGPYAIDPLYLDDPRRRLAENQSLQNAALQALSTTGDVRSLASIAPSLQGESLGNAARIIDEVHSKNIDRFNEWGARQGNRQLAYNQYAADLATQRPLLSKDIDIQNLNANRMYMNKIGQAETNLWNNMVKWGLMNSVNQRFNVDPVSGRTFFRQGLSPNALASFNQQTAAASGNKQQQQIDPRLLQMLSNQSEVDPYVPYYNLYNATVPS